MIMKNILFSMDIKIYDLSYKVDCNDIIEVKYKEITIYYILDVDIDDIDISYNDFSIEKCYNSHFDEKNIFSNINIVKSNLIKKLYENFIKDFNELLII